MNRSVSVVLAVAVTGVCLWFLLTPEVLHSLRRMGTDAKPLPVVAAFLFCTLVQWLRAWRYSMMTAARLDLPDNAMVRIACQANFLNFALPFRLGELGYPVLMQRRYGIRFLQATGVLLLARLFDLAAVGCIFLASAWALGMVLASTIPPRTVRWRSRPPFGVAWRAGFAPAPGGPYVGEPSPSRSALRSMRWATCVCGWRWWRSALPSGWRWR
jgi:hypothetical protein